LVPALRATKADLAPALKEGSALQLPGYLRFGLRNLLIVVQVAVSLMLLLITGFLVMGFNVVSSVQTKFDPHTMYLLSIDPSRDGYAPDKAQALFESIPEQLKTAGTVRSVALAAQAPFSLEDEDEANQLTAQESPGAPAVQQPVIREWVGAGYFAALIEPLLAGREFVELDQRDLDQPRLDQRKPDGSKSLPVVLNESAARGFFGNGSAIGKRVGDDQRSYEVVGVVRDLKNGVGISQSLIYLPLTQCDFARPPADGMTIMVRSDLGTDVLSAIRHQIAVLDPNLNIFNVRTLSDHLELSRPSQRFAITTYSGIGLFGLVLAAIGLAGVTGYAVALRRKEIGIRMALGARGCA
jgi:putative ABC transport system permease protein